MPKKIVDDSSKRNFDSLEEIVKADKSGNNVSKFIGKILAEEITCQDLSQKIKVAGEFKEVKLVIEYPSNEANATGLYSVFVCDKSTNENYMSFYTKDKVLFNWYITGFVLTML